jgi:REP element-mobilizing transposase RayT
MRKRSRQLTLDQARKPTGHGGWRPGAGRPRGRKKCAHITRETFAARFPLHVTLRTVPGVRLRNEPVLRVVRKVVAEASRLARFRVVEFNVLGNHVHLVVEAAGAEALARGMQGLTVRLARGINACLGRTGKLFAERYHARALRTPREVRNVLRYVLLNARHHAAERGETLARHWIDPYSSAAERQRGCLGLGPQRAQPRPTAEAKSWLLTTGWRRHGLLVFDDVPGTSP